MTMCMIRAFEVRWFQWRRIVRRDFRWRNAESRIWKFDSLRRKLQVDSLDSVFKYENKTKHWWKLRWFDSSLLWTSSDDNF